jgi:hypothetical protein
MIELFAMKEVEKMQPEFTFEPSEECDCCLSVLEFGNRLNNREQA